MKSNKNHLYSYIFLLIIICIVGLLSCQGVMADDSQNVSFKPPERTCDFEINTVGKKLVCKDKKSIAYSINPISLSGKDENGFINDIFGYCYYDSSVKGYFYEITKFEKKYNMDGTPGSKYELVGNTIGKAFIYVSNLKQFHEDLNIRIHVKKGESIKGCARFVYGNNEHDKYLFSYEQLTSEEIKKELALNDTSIGSVEIDDQTMQKIESCVETELTNGKHCDESDYEKTIKDAVNACINRSNAGYTYESSTKISDKITDTYTKDEKELNRISYLRTVVCTLFTNCHANVANIKNFLNKYDKNYDPYTAKKIIQDTFPENVRSCVEGYLGYDFNKDAAEEAARLKAAVPDAAEAAANELDITAQQDFSNNGQQYYTYPDNPKSKGYIIVSGNDCAALLSEETTKLFNTALRYMQYLGPVLVVVLSTIDFIKVAASGSPDDMKKAWNKLVKRLIAAILLFFVALITRLLLSFFDITVPENCLK